MYKKRFARWGFQKNSRRLPTTGCLAATKHRSATLAERHSDFTRNLSPIDEYIQLSYDDRLRLSFLDSVQRWSLAFFESTHFGVGLSSFSPQHLSIEPSPCRNPKEIIIALQLVSDLLDRGHGTLAGKIIRKAFLLVEEMLILDGPALVWNLLEIFHNMVNRRHERLFSMLLTHIITLVHGRTTETHPLSVMLYNLRTFTQLLTSIARRTSSSPRLLRSYSPDLSDSVNDEMTSSQLYLSYLLKQAWILNAEIVFDNFDPTWFRLYLYLHWESCSVPLPLTIIRTVKAWLSQLEAKQETKHIEDIRDFKGLSTGLRKGKCPTLSHLFGSDENFSPMQSYEMLRTRSLAALHNHLNSVLVEDSPFNEMVATKLRIMPALVKAKMIEKLVDSADDMSMYGIETARVSRDEASSLACIVRALMDIDAEHGGNDIRTLPNAIERMRSLVALREYANGETDPQVIQEMWLLESVLIEGGHHEEAQRIRLSATRRLEKYTEDIPLNFV